MRFLSFLTTPLSRNKIVFKNSIIFITIFFSDYKYIQNTKFLKDSCKPISRRIIDKVPTTLIFKNLKNYKYYRFFNINKIFKSENRYLFLHYISCGRSWLTRHKQVSVEHYPIARLFFLFIFLIFGIYFLQSFFVLQYSNYRSWYDV